MATFTLECPKCGSLNSASTFVFAKKYIKCGTCSSEINVKQSRLISKECPKCKKVFVCDQAKLSGKKCPNCGEALNKDFATTEYKAVNVHCPQCDCSIETDKTKAVGYCPICGMRFNVQSLIEREKLVSAAGVSVIKYEGDNKTFVWKHPIEDFNYGSQLIVHESQEAVFFYKGRALDTFERGEYILETENIPLLKEVCSVPSDQKVPFHAEVYFINKTVQMGFKWGTDSRVRFLEPKTGIPLDIGASGELSLQVINSRKVLSKLVGTTSGLKSYEVLGADQRINPVQNTIQSDNGRNISHDYDENSGWASTVKGLFKPVVMTILKTHLAQAIKNLQINVLEIDERLEELSTLLREKVSAAFEEFGLSVPNFYITNISLPEDDPNFVRIRKLITASYFGKKEAEVEAEIIAAKRGVGRTNDRTRIGEVFC